MDGFFLPEKFLIGTANSAFQSEGALDRDGRTPSTMDYYAKKCAGKTNHYLSKDEVLTMDLPDRGCFFYDNYEAYIDDMAKTGQNTFRFSIAWSRIIPTGFGEVNQKGIDFYNKVIDKLLANNITPLVDLCHWDIPQCLDELDGYASPEFPKWFEAYAKVCFEAFGDRVKLWSTFNEPGSTVSAGYIAGSFPPFIKDLRKGHFAALQLILAHYRAVKLYKSMKLGGKIGAVLHFMAIYPGSIKEEDQLAAQIRTGRQFGWWAGPMLEGKFPEVVLKNCPKILATMPENFQQQLAENFVKMDFIGVNYYYAKYSSYDPNNMLRSTNADDFFAQPEGFRHPPYYPGLFDALLYVKERYGDIEMMVTENGLGAMFEGEEAELNDDRRCEYIREHLRMIARAIKVGVNVTGYYYWNDADSYEELVGYDYKFGLTYVDEKGNRTWKKSRYYFSDICKTHQIY